MQVRVNIIDEFSARSEHGVLATRVRRKEGRLRRIQMMSYLHLRRLNMQLARSRIYYFHGSGATFVSEHKSSRRLSYPVILLFLSEIIFSYN
jgi:hypothetical protein